ncbi:acyltransferase [Vibrio sp. DNB22_10_4]
MRKLYFYLRCIPKTLWFNFRYFPLATALRFPVLVCHRTYFRDLRGNVTVPNDAKFGKIKLGFGEVQIADGKYSRFIWSLKKGGTVNFGRGNKIGTGSRLHISGDLTIGDGVNFSGETTIVCQKAIRFGDRALISWQTLFMDTDMHAVERESGVSINSDKEVLVGSDVWVCARSTVLKGSVVSDNSIVSAAALVIGEFKKDAIIGGNPAKIIGSMAGKRFVH